MRHLHRNIFDLYLLYLIEKNLFLNKINCFARFWILRGRIECLKSKADIAHQSYWKMSAASESRDSCTREISSTRRSSRVQKNENYLSAEQCRLTVSTGRPNSHPHYSLTAGMRSVHTRLPIHGVFRAASLRSRLRESPNIV